MPKSPEDATTKDVLYPDDLPGNKYCIDQYAYWDASEPEDREELPEDARYGMWLPVVTTKGTDRIWASAPRHLRERLIEEDASEGDFFEVIEVEKGPGDSDPYHVQLRLVQEGDAL